MGYAEQIGDLEYERQRDDKVTEPEPEGEDN